MSTLNYDFYVKIGDGAGNFVRGVLLDQITVNWGVMGCGSTVVSRNILVAAPTLSFAHDTNSASATTVQLSTFELAPPAPCFTYTGVKIYLTGTQTDETAIFWFN